MHLFLVGIVSLNSGIDIKLIYNISSQCTGGNKILNSIYPFDFF